MVSTALSHHKEKTMPGHECLTLEELEKAMKDENKQQKMQEANQKANACTLCKRVWMKFWATQSK
jgi:hypothetical protein